MVMTLQSKEISQKVDNETNVGKNFNISQSQQPKKPADNDELVSRYDFQKLLSGIARHELLILIIALLCAAAGSFLAYRLVTTYEASAVVVYQDDRVVNLPGGNTLASLSMPTVVDLIQSPGNYAAVKKILGLEESATKLKSMVEVTLPKTNSKFIHIDVKANNPYLAVDIANTLAKTSVKAAQDFNLKQLLQALDGYKSLLSNVMVRLNSQLKEIEDFKSKNRYLEMTADLSQFATLVNTTRSRLEDATLHYHSLEVQYETLSSAIAQLPDEIPFITANGVSSLQSRIVSLQNAISDAKLKYAKDNPRLKALESLLEELQGESKASKDGTAIEGHETTANPIKEQLQIEMLRLTGSLKSAQQMKEDLELSYAQLDRELENMPAKQIAFGKLLSAKDLSQQEVKFLSDSIDTVQLMINWPRGSIDLYELADNATQRAGPLLGILIPIIAGLLGALLGVLIAFIMELRDDKLRTSKEVELAYQVPCIVTIPMLSNFTAENSEKKTLFFTRILAERIDAMRKQFAPGKECQVIGIGSSLQGEGKSTISNMLANYYTKLERKVLLIRADPQGLIENDNAGQKKVLEQYLRSPTNLDDLILTGDVDSITVGPNSDLIMKEQLKSSAMNTLWNALKDRYNTIIIDIPGLIESASAVNFFALANVRIFVINSSEVNRKIVDESISHVQDNHLPLQGIVLNHVMPVFIKDQRTINEMQRLKEGLWKRLFSWKAR
jgi:uncharacterized protein involved in exopolysaccharide biosynthesis/cellulose biosynthesis protein BcsQ